jgi:prophage regulatory protein
MARLLRLEPILERTGQTKTPFYACIAAGTMTRPVKIGPRAAAWPEDEVDAIVGARIAGAGEEELRALVRKLHNARRSLEVFA